MIQLATLESHEPRAYDRIGAFMNSVRILSLSKRKSWLSKMIDADRLAINYTSDGIDTDNIENFAGIRKLSLSERTGYKRTLFSMIDSLNMTYSGKWDMFILKYHFLEIDEETGNDKNVIRFVIEPVIHFEDFYIENTSGLRRRIKDLFVAIPMVYMGEYTDEETDKTYANISPRVPYGAKTTWQQDEIPNGYVHSHLRRSTSPINRYGFKLGKFCIGGGSELRDLIIELENEYNAGTFGLYLLMIETLVKWESVEGRPHMYMKSIVSKQSTQVDESLTYCKAVFEGLRSEIIHPPEEFKFTLFNDRYVIKEDARLESNIKTGLIKLGQEDSKFYNFLCKEQNDDTGSEKVFHKYISDNSSSKERIIYDEYLIFNGRKILMKQIANLNENDLQSTGNISTYNVYPKFLKYVANEINKLLLETFVRSYHTEGQD